MIQGAPKIANEGFIALITRTLMVDISIVNGFRNQLITDGAPHCRKMIRT